ncbi:MAG: glycosyltransferase family 2 protein [Acidobacteriia bacterium]|nr:glycosyltransferase family 2 protein [Terriglobia bacterium]
MPTVSVVIPAFNCGQTVAEALKSVLAQTFHDFEIVVVDDGSQDNTAAGVRSAAPNAVYVRQENAGVSAARNHGIRIATGEYIAFLDADDVWDPHKLEKQVRVLDEEPEIALVCSDFSTASSEGSVEPSYLKHCRHARSGYVFDEVVQEYFILTSSVLVRRSCLAEVGGFDESLRVTEDRDLWLRICHRWKISLLTDPLVIKRNRPGNLSSDTGRAGSSRVKVFEKALRTLPDLSSRSRRLILDQLSANSCALGYDYFARFMMGEARQALRKSLTYRWTNGRAWLYLLACYLPVPMIRAIRRAKQAIL